MQGHHNTGDVRGSLQAGRYAGLMQDRAAAVGDVLQPPLLWAYQAF
jgi:hypothetical protein